MKRRQKKKPIHSNPLYQVFTGKADKEPSFVTRIRLLAELYGSQVCSDYCRIEKVTKEGCLVLTEWARAQ